MKLFKILILFLMYLPNACVLLRDYDSAKKSCELANLIVAANTLSELSKDNLSENQKNDIIFQYILLTQCKLQ
jgi:hypothetical protein